MKPVEKIEGINGLLSVFRKLVRGSKKITFVGCPGWCNPFAELLGYVLRYSGKQMVFVPNLKKELAAKLVITEYGMQIGEKADASSDTVVLLGGLAMPKMGIDVNEMKKLIYELTRDASERKIIGVCIGGVFQKAGWDKQIDFDYIVDADMVVVTYGDMHEMGS